MRPPRARLEGHTEESGLHHDGKGARDGPVAKAGTWHVPCTGEATGGRLGEAAAQAMALVIWS